MSLTPARATSSTRDPTNTMKLPLTLGALALAVAVVTATCNSVGGPARGSGVYLVGVAGGG